MFLGFLGGMVITPYSALNNPIVSHTFCIASAALLPAVVRAASEACM